MRPAAWTTREVARRASVSTRTVQRWIESGGLPARRVVPAPVEGYGPWPHPQAERLRYIA